MEIDYALILSAGLGTRMGEIGKVVPKVLWPIYFKTLLELQIRYCQDLGIKKIYINTHFLNEEIESFLKENKLDSMVQILFENPLLDSGGAIHNLSIRKEVNYQGTLLLINGDQFLFFNQEFWLKAKSRIAHVRAVLFGITVDKNSNYNETIIENNQFLEIKKNTEKIKDYVTYSGLGLLNLDGLKPVKGISKFFETVANYKEEKIEFVVPDQFEYWDFGTAEMYCKNIFKLCKKEERGTTMGKFLMNHDAFRGEESRFVDFSNSAIDIGIAGIYKANHIHAKGIYQPI